jgi:V/A-type H+-transporting ATPase subunit E
VSKIDLAHDRVQQLCDFVELQALEPAKRQAHDLIEDARRQAQEIIQQAKHQANLIAELQAKDLIQDRKVAESALKQAGKFAVQRLRQEIEENLFNSKIKQMACTPFENHQVLTQLIQNYVEMLKQNGVSQDFSVMISSKLSQQQLTHELNESILGQLREGQLLAVLPNAGFKIQLHDKKVIIDVTDAALEEILIQYLQKDFRENFFNS